MSFFKYSATSTQTSGGPSIQGQVEAPDEASALSILQSRGLLVFELKSTGGDISSDASLSFSESLGFKPRISSTDLASTLYQISTLIEAGVPLADAVDNAAQGQAEKKHLSIALGELHTQLRSGIRLSEALRAGSLDWPDHVIELVRAGELTGKLGASLRAAVEQMEMGLAFDREVRNAMIYPSVLMVSGLAATLLVFVFVVPKFAGILSNPKADIPAFSLLILQSGLWLSLHKEFVAITVGIVAAAGVVFSQQAALRLALWDFLTELPVTRKWIAHSELARWGTMFAVLLANSVPMLEALGLASNSLRGTTARKKSEMLIADVRGGKTLADAMRQHAFADATSINLIAVGERSGALPKTSQALAAMHTADSQQALKRFLVLLEPITILAISVVLGSIMISVMLAVTSLTNVI